MRSASESSCFGLIDREIADQADANPILVDVGLATVASVHLLNPTRSHLDEAVRLAIGAVVDDEVVGQPVDHPARTMRRVKNRRRADPRGAMVNDDPIPFTDWRRALGPQRLQHQTQHCQNEQNRPSRCDLHLRLLSFTTYGVNSPASTFGICARSTTLPFSISRAVT